MPSNSIDLIPLIPLIIKFIMAVVNHKNLGGLINIHDLGKTMHRGLIDG